MTGYVRARIDEDLKDDAAAVLDTLGLTVSDVIRMVLTRIARDKALPYELITPNAETIAAMEESRALIKEGKLRFKTPQELFSALENGSGKD